MDIVQQLVQRTMDENGLEKAADFIYTLSGTPSRSFNLDRLVILIHPYGGLDFMQNETTNPDYVQRRDRLVSEHEDPILMGIELGLESSTFYDGNKPGVVRDVSPNDVISWVASLNPSGPRYFYFTEYGNPSPILQGTEELFGKIKDLFSPDKIVLGGAELEVSESGRMRKDSGCVNGMYQRLKDHFKTEVNKEYCWLQQQA